MTTEDDAHKGLSVNRLARVIEDWMPDGADVSSGFDGQSVHLVGHDLARYLVERDHEYGPLVGDVPVGFPGARRIEDLSDE